MSAENPGTAAGPVEAEGPHEITPDAAGLLNYLRLVARMHAEKSPLRVWGSVEELILGMVREPITVDHPRLPDGIGVMEARACFRNALLTALDHPHLVYCEGFATGAGIPTNHAWCLDTSTGQIVDPTWTRPGKPNGGGPLVYMGLAFSHGFMRRVLAESDLYPAVLADDWRRKHRAVRCGLVYGRDGLVEDWGDPPPF